MLYMVIGLFITFILVAYSRYLFLKNDEFHWKEVFKIFDDVSIGAYLTLSFSFSCLIFSLFGICGEVAIVNYDKSMSATYELKEINEKQYFNRVNSNVSLFCINDDGMLTHETFNENEDSVKYQLKDGKASVTIQKQNKIEPSTFEKVWYLKGILSEEDKINSVIITIPEDSNLGL